LNSWDTGRGTALYTAFREAVHGTEVLARTLDPNSLPDSFPDSLQNCSHLGPKIAPAQILSRGWSHCTHGTHALPRHGDHCRCRTRGAGHSFSVCHGRIYNYSCGRSG
jgi:hypothetical protein